MMKKANPQIGTFGFCRPSLGQTNNETNEMHIEKRDKRIIQAILAT